MISRSNANKMIAEIMNLSYLGKYTEAAKIADEIQWARVKDIKLLNMASDVYDKCGRYHEAKRVLMVVYNRIDASKRLVYKLSELSAKAGDMADAKEFYWEFRKIAPNDAGKLILAYHIMCAENESDEKKIEVLELYLKEDFDEEWAYILAQLYYKTEQTEKCIKICDEIILWYSGGEYGIAALRLKHKCLGIEDDEDNSGNKINIIGDTKKDKAESRVLEKEELEIDGSDAMLSDLVTENLEEEADIETSEEEADIEVSEGLEIEASEEADMEVSEELETKVSEETEIEGSEEESDVETSGKKSEVQVSGFKETDEASQMILQQPENVFCEDEKKAAGSLFKEKAGSFIILEKATDKEKIFVFGGSEIFKASEGKSEPKISEKSESEELGADEVLEADKKIVSETIDASKTEGDTTLLDDDSDTISKILGESAVTAEPGGFSGKENTKSSDQRIKVVGYIDGRNNFTSVYEENQAASKKKSTSDQKISLKNITERFAFGGKNNTGNSLANNYNKKGGIKIFLIECSQMRGGVKYAVNKLHYIHREYGTRMIGAAKISGTKFSVRGAASSISVLKGRDLIIEGVTGVTYEAISEVTGLMADGTKPVILAFVDTPTKLALFVNRHRSFAEKCEYIYEEASISRTEFINYINNYAYKLNAVLDDTADEELEDIADEMLEDGLAFTISDAAELAKRAFERAQKPGIRGVFEAKKDADGYLILRSRHFDRG